MNYIQEQNRCMGGPERQKADYADRAIRGAEVAPCSPGLIPVALDQLEAAVRELDCVLGQLGMKLNPVMRQEPPQETNKCEVTRRSDVPVAYAIENEADKINMLRRAVVGLIDRVEL